ncbi:MAG: hypothetical protein RLZZ326_4156 [Planctomycetota bacterium]
MGAGSHPTRPTRPHPLVGLMAVVLLASLSCGSAAADETALAGRVETLLAVRCLECHAGPDAGPDPQGGLALDTAAAFARGGQTGPAVVPGDADASLLVRAVRRQDPAVAPMPPDEPLTGDEIALIEAWVAAGAPWPGAAPAEDDDGSPVGSAWEDPRNPVTRRWRGERIDLWSFQPLERSAVPSLRGDEGHGTHPDGVPAVIDAFLNDRLAAAGIGPLPRADRRTLVRRMTFDVTGLPPTPDEVEAFVADEAPDAVERLVDRLLASSAYGEHLAITWLDAVRYADTNGFERDELRPQIWRYRDWCIDAFNADMPYDRFLTEQLAGDELAADPPADETGAGALVATGYLRLGPFDSTAPIFQEAERHRAELLAEIVSTTGSAVLGLAMSCCNCHDHKSDPLLQSDFFRIQACFQGTDAREMAIDPAPVAAEIAAHNEPIQVEIAAAESAGAMATTRLDSLLAAAAAEGEAEVPSVVGLRDALTNEIVALEERVAELKSTLRSATLAEVVSEVSEIPATHVLAQGSHREPRQEVVPGVLAAFDPAALAVAPPPGGRTSGRRLALAQWLASAGNPLTARVIVNRVWQRLFGRGIVATPNDFGFRGAPPTHPELLDWLACEFRDGGSSLKSLHRAILLTDAYQRSSIAAGPSPAHQADPDNQLLWRQQPRRLGAEAIRDALLAVAGLLRGERGGPPRWPPVAEEILHANPAIIEFVKEGADGRPQGWYAQPVEETFVRSLYLVRKRSLPLPFLQPFDLPDGVNPCGRRDVTTVAPQSLNLLNDDLVVHAAAGLADRVAAAAGPDVDAWPAAVVRLALGRPIEPEERTAAAELLARHIVIHSSPPDGAAADIGGDGAAARRALIDLCRAVLNVSEFLHVD